MFNDDYGLTQAVLDGRKTMTRRIIKCPRTFRGDWVAGFNVHIRQSDKKIVDYPCMYDADGREFDGGEILPKYKIGEVVAIAQSYKDAETGDYDHSYREDCGVFTLQDVLNKMPYKIDVYEMSISFNGKWIIRYKHPKDNISLHFVMNKSLIQAAYEILCWYMEKEYLKLIKPYVVNES